jgi:putative nucleotidyltransferase with HDIG domain
VDNTPGGFFTDMNRNTACYIVFVSVVAILFALRYLPPAELAAFTPQQWRALAGFGVLALLAQLAAIDFGGARPAHSIILPPSATLLTAVPVIAISDIVLRRNVWWICFNVAQITLAVGLGATVYAQWTSIFQTDAISYVGVLFLAGIFFSTNILLSSVGLAFSREQPLIPTFLAVVGPKGSNLLYDLLSSPLVVITVAVHLVYGVAGMFLLVMPLIILRNSYATRQKLEHANRDLLYALVKAIETRDIYTSGHSRRVATLSTLIAEDMGLSARRVQRVGTAALLHDIGKIDADFTAVLLKPHSLTPDERDLIQTHAVRGADMLRDLGSLDAAVIAAVRHHHERFDGKGYPDQIGGKDIPLEARIIMMSDSIDAMLSDRPYRRALQLDTVKAELASNKGTQFDPEIVEIVLERDTLTRAVALVQEWRCAQAPREHLLAAAN